MKENKSMIRVMVRVAIFSALIAVLAQLAIPLPAGVPFTMQTVAVALCGYVLGAKLGVTATALYILLGAIGLPVFAQFTGGFGILIGPTGGFIFGFLALAFCCGLSLNMPIIPRFAISILGLAICHLLGVTQFALVTGTPWLKAAMLASVPFLLNDVIKLVLSYYLAKSIVKALSKANIVVQPVQNK